MRKFVKNSIISTKFFLKDNTLSIVFITLFTVGCALGAFSFFFSGDKAQSLFSIIGQYYSENETLSVMALFSRNLISSLIYLGIMYLGGLCAIGLPIIGIIPIVKGLAVGMIISYQYLYSGIKGFLYAFVIVLLPSALLLAVFNMAYVEGIYMSLSVSNGIFNGKPRESKYNLSFMTFTKRYLIFAVATVIISILEAVLSSVFSKVL